MRHFLLAALIASLLFPCVSVAQSSNATITGVIEDPGKAVLPGTRVTVVNTQTGERTTTKTNGSGLYTLSTLIPGTYRIEVDKQGFRGIIEGGIILHTQDVLQLNFHMAVGSTAETVTVSASGNNINTTDATVGTVVDRKFVESIPLNGRSFENLVLLSPGVTTANPQGTSGDYGEFSVNGQRTDANNFTLDGASAMNQAPLNTSMPSRANATATGTTQAIISVDALQEFRIATSTYSAEFGRSPGAQVSFTSRSGTNQYHGTAFDYLRNYALDANNWFNDYSMQPLPKPQERQNDFGGTLGGPLSIPRVYSGADRAFFFFNYEGLRLNEPVPATISYVPSNGTNNTATNYAKPAYMNLRGNVSQFPGLQAALNAFPLPNCTTAINPQCVDHGDGLSPFLLATATPGTIDSLSARIDYAGLRGTRLFARYADTESSYDSIYYNIQSLLNLARIRTYLLGADSVIHGTIANQLRLQYSPGFRADQSTGSSIGGSVPISGNRPVTFNTLQGLPGSGGKNIMEFLNFGGGEATAVLAGLRYGTRQWQENATDTVTWVHGRHSFKVGADYRQTTTTFGQADLEQSPQAYYYYESPAQVLANTVYSFKSTNFGRQDPTFKNMSLFLQDEWRVQPRLSLSLGLRWDLNPPPSVSGAPQYTYTGNINNPSTLALSKLGANLYATTYHDFAPRGGVAWVVHGNPGRELVLRAGAGLFFDTGQQASFYTFGAGDGLGASSIVSFSASAKKSFPQNASTILVPINTTPAAPYTLLYVSNPGLVPPSTIHWNVSMEQALGSSQSVTIGYVGSQGRNLLTLREYSMSALTNNLFSTIEQYENGPGSNYNALQIQYKRQMVKGLQVLASYTWAHAIDWSSTDSVLLPLQRGNSAQDLRHNMTSALMYDVPNSYAERWKRAILGNWSTDLWLVMRTGFPVHPTGATVIDPASGSEYPERLNYNGGNPYVYKAGIPGGRQFNPAVFSVPTTAQGVVGNSPRNFLRGFGEFDTAFALQRTFPLYERFHLQFRGDAFNIFNHPNFGALNLSCGTTTTGATCNNTLMGQATSTLNNALTGSAQLYSQGGPRSFQFALKLQF